MLPNLKAQHAVHRQGVDNLVQVKDLQRIPTLFEVLHQCIDFITIKQLYELTAQTTVAMFAAERAFVFLDQQSGLIGHFSEFPLAFCFLDVDNGAQMQLTRADMCMINAAQAKVFKHLGEVGHISRQLFRSHSRVFYHSDGFGVAFHAGE